MKTGNGYFTKLLFLLAMFIAYQSGVYAHTDEYLDSVGGTHGGMLRMAGPYHLELVASKGEAIVWVMDHGNMPQSVEGIQGQLILFQDENRISIDLTADGESLLRGKDSRINGKGYRYALLTLSINGQPPMQVRFAKTSKLNANEDKQHVHPN